MSSKHSMRDEGDDAMSSCSEQTSESSVSVQPIAYDVTACAQIVHQIRLGLDPPYVKIAIRKSIMHVLKVLVNPTEKQRRIWNISDCATRDARTLFTDLTTSGLLANSKLPFSKLYRDRIRSVLNQIGCDTAHSISPKRIVATEQLIKMSIPLHVPYSLEFLKDKTTLIHVADEALAQSLPSTLQPLFEAHRVEGTIMAEYSENGGAFSECHKELCVIVSGGPIMQYSPATNAAFSPSGTVGVAVRLLTSDESFAEQERGADSPLVELNGKIGFLTALHVCEEWKESIDKLGTVLSDESGADIAVVRLSEEWRKVGTCINLLHFPSWEDQDLLQEAASDQGSALGDNLLHFPSWEDQDLQQEGASDQGSALDELDDGEGYEFRSSVPNILPAEEHDPPIGTQIFKIGATTGLTRGFLRGFYSGPEFNNAKRCAIIDWEAPGDHFADNGDCGAVYFYSLRGRNIPLAVHVGSAKSQSNRDISIGAVFDANVPYSDYYISFDIAAHCNVVQFPLDEQREMLRGGISAPVLAGGVSCVLR